MDLRLHDKVIVVTGGAKGIGEAVVKTLAAEGAVPVIVGRSEADNQRLVGELSSNGQQSHQVVAELANPEECEKVIKDVTGRFGRIDGVVNNAGVNDGVGLENGDYKSFIQSLHNNLVHYYLIVHHALPELIKSKGAVVNVSSKTAITGQGNTSGYAAANGGRIALTREWAVELLKYGIRVNAVVVAECFTPAYQKWIQTIPNGGEKLKEITAQIPLGARMTSVEELADTVVFLLSPRSSHTTGQWIHVDGGYVHLDRALANG